MKDLKLFNIPAVFLIGVVLCAIALITSCSKQQAPDITLESCLSDLTNVNIFCETPLGHMNMLSSYDRSGGNNDWDQLANIDSKRQAVIADLKGPGAVRRLWMTGMPTNLVVSLYFDGEKEPRFKRNYGELFLKKQQFPFTAPLCCESSSGCYCYLPFPYGKSLKIVITVPEGDLPRAYYHVNYESFPDNIRVESFPAVLSTAQLEKIQAVAKVWENTEQETRNALSHCKTAEEIQLSPGDTGQWLNLQEPGIVKTLWMEIKTDENLSALARAQLLRQLIMTITWEDNPKPSVETPLGDFFLNGLRNREFASNPLAYLDGKYICRFPMPFNKSAVGTIRNESDSHVIVRYGYAFEPNNIQKPCNYFHAAWNQSSRTGLPFVLASTKGSGHIVGCYLISIGTDGSWNILEADESIYRDGEALPSMRGTGLEDYFNAGWYYGRGLFTRPLHGLLEKAAMRTAQYRIHLPDRIDFKEDFRFAFEFGHGNHSQGYMSSVVYWYQSLPGHAGTILSSINQRYPVQDRFEIGATMCGLFELERIGHLEEAIAWCNEISERHSNTPLVPLYELRATAYREVVEGYTESISNAYKEIADKYQGTMAEEQARILTWYHQSNSNALLGVQMTGQFKLYIDRQLVSQGNNPDTLSIIKLQMESGSHELALELIPTQPEPKILLYLRTHRGNLALTSSTDPDNERAPSGWTCAKEKPSDWPGTTDPEIAWMDSVMTGFTFPQMSHWLFIPNALVNMQSSGYICRLWTDWHKGLETAYLRRTIDLP